MNKHNSIKLLAAVLCLALSLSACDALGEESSSQPQSSSQSQSVSAPPARVFSKGTLSDDEYVNEFWAISFQPPESVSMMTAAQISELMELGGKALGTDEDTIKQLDELVGQYEMVANDMATGSSLMLTSQQLSATGAGSDALLQAMIDATKAAVPAGEVKLLGEGEPTQVTIAELPFTMQAMEIKAEGAPTVTVEQYLYVDGKYMLGLVLGYSNQLEGGKASAQLLLDALQPMDEEG